MSEVSVSIGMISNAARFLVRNVQGASGIGVAQLQFFMEAATRSAEVSDQVLWLDGQLTAHSLGAGSGFVGRVVLESAPLRLLAPGDTQRFTLTVDISYRQLQIIEERRTAGLNLYLYLNGTTMRDGALERIALGSFEYEITQSDWIKILEQMQYRRVLLLELDAPDAVRTPELVAALNFYRDAEKHYLQGQWRNTVESLRQSLAALVGKRADDEDDESAVKAGANALRKESTSAAVGYRKRAEQVRRALKFSCDLGAHPEVADTQKRDASAALLMVGGLLQGW